MHRQWPVMVSLWTLWTCEFWAFLAQAVGSWTSFGSRHFSPFQAQAASPAEISDFGEAQPHIRRQNINRFPLPEWPPDCPRRTSVWSPWCAEDRMCCHGFVGFPVLIAPPCIDLGVRIITCQSPELRVPTNPLNMIVLKTVVEGSAYFRTVRIHMVPPFERGSRCMQAHRNWKPIHVSNHQWIKKPDCHILQHMATNPTKYEQCRGPMWSAQHKFITNSLLTVLMLMTWHEPPVKDLQYKLMQTQYGQRNHCWSLATTVNSPASWLSPAIMKGQLAQQQHDSQCWSCWWSPDSNGASFMVNSMTHWFRWSWLGFRMVNDSGSPSWMLVFIMVTMIPGIDATLCVTCWSCVLDVVGWLLRPTY